MNIEKPEKGERAEKLSVTTPKDDELANLFTYHSPTDEDIPKYQQIRSSGLALARVIRDCCPVSADASAALRKVREAVMTANAAIAVVNKEQWP
jgi:hypothetical protein